MQVLKRNNTHEEVSFDKVLKRIRVLSGDLDVNYHELAQKVCSRIYDGVKTSELDELAATMCSSLIIENPDYGILASRIVTSNHHKNTSPSFSETIQILYDNHIISRKLYSIVQDNKHKLNNYIDYNKDYEIDYFGFMTLEKMYLLRIDGKPIERIQHMFMRVALGIHGDDIKDALNTYDLMSSKYFIHATPTLFNSGTPVSQLSSCFLVNMEEDSIDGIFNTLKDCALISKYAGGIGLNIHDIRCKNSYIKGTNGISSGIIPMMRVFNNTARYVNQAGRRNGSIAMFLEPWHADIEAFLNLRKNHGAEEERARDLFYALWIPDLFMERVKANGKWSLMCPNQSKGLSDVYGKEFEDLYIKYENQGNFIKQVNAQDLWFKVLEAQIETGLPYIGYKDSVNKKTNQSNIGIIKSSNLCMEICEVSKPDEIAVCNLASICLKTYVCDNNGAKYFDFDKMGEVVKTIVKNLNKIIDINFYPVDKAEKSNKLHRPIGIGIQGLADTFILMNMPFDSQEALELNKNIFETMYYYAIQASMELAIKYGPYSTFNGSPMSNGIFQFDMWNVDPTNDRYNWTHLKDMVVKHGVRNSLLISPMPTASTSQILGSNECFEPLTSNMYKRKTLAGEFIIVNKYLSSDLIKLNLWTKDIRDKIVLNDGSIQNIDEIPQNLKNLYKTVWEIKQKNLIDQAIARGPFICQSQSMNLFLEAPDFKKLSSMHFYTWQNGLKTGIYYLRSKPKAKTQQFTLNPKLTKMGNAEEVVIKKKVENVENVAFPNDEAICHSCSG